MQAHSGTNYLPLFPDVIKESLSLEGPLAVGLQQLKLHVSLLFDVHEVYGTTPISEWSDSEKIKMADKLARFIVIQKRVTQGDFTQLFIDLDFDSEWAKLQHLMQIWKVLDEVAGSMDASQFFSFRTGGIGAFTGSHFAEKLFQLANEVGTTELKVQLAFRFPTLFKPLNPSVKDSKGYLLLSSDGFNQVLTMWQKYFAAQSDLKKDQIKRVIKDFLSEPNFYTEYMLLWKTHENLQLAEQIYQL